MSAEECSEETIRIRAENIGGIDRTETAVSPGVTTLTGRNATNRTSFLQAMMAALGSDRVSLKGDADEGHVELTIGNSTYTRTLTRENDVVSTSGNPYLDDPPVADLFTFLLESNEARRAVARGEDLRDLIMRPIDTDAIRTEISELEDERRQLDDRIDDLDTLEADLPDLEVKRRRLDSRIEDKRDDLDRKERELDAADRDVDETREEKAELEDALDELRGTRSDLEAVRHSIDTHEESIDALHDERATLEADYDDLPDAPAGERSELDSEIRRLRERETSLESELSEVQSIVGFNEDMLDGEELGRLDSLTETQAESDGSVTDQLVADEIVTCWTCGSNVEAGQIETTLDHLRDLRRETLDDLNTLGEELDDLVAERNALEDKQRERDRLERRLDTIEGELDDHEATLSDLADERDALTDEIEDLETAVEQLESDDYTELLDLHKEANQLEFELGRLESDREDIAAEIATVEDRLGERDHLEAQRDDLQTELEDLRTRIERIETEAVGEFNDHMETVLGLLDYANIERIWIERIERTVREGRRKVDKSVFELHVVRTTRSGTAYEDTIGHLSESEREVTGLVFALAGYLVHDLYETVPVMLLDSLEALDSVRIATLVEYFAEYAEYLVVALLPEDATALDENHQRISNI